MCVALKNQQGMLRCPGTGNCGKPKPFLGLKEGGKEMALPIFQVGWSQGSKVMRQKCSVTARNSMDAERKQRKKYSEWPCLFYSPA